MKLNYKRTICVGFAFFLICAFWQAYDTIIPKILTDKFGMAQGWSGVIMALDNVLALFMLPIFGALSDKCKSRFGRRTPYIVIGTVIAVIAFVGLSFIDNAQLAKIGDAAQMSEKGVAAVYADAEIANAKLKTHDGEEYVISEKFSEDEMKTVAADAAQGDKDALAAWDTYFVPARQAVAAKTAASHRSILVLFMAVLLVTLVSMSLFRSPAVALMPDVTIKPLRSKANAVINLMGTFGGILVLLLGIVFGTGKAKNAMMSYTLFFTVIAAIMVLALVIFLLTVREMKFVEDMAAESKRYGIDNGEDDDGSGSRKLSKGERISLLLILASVVLWFFGYNAVTSKYSVYAGKVLNLDYNKTLMIANAAAIVSYLPVGFISSKIGRKKAILAGIVILATAFGVAAFLREGSSAILMNVLFALAGIGWATINVNSFPMVVELAKGGNVGKYTGYYYTASMAAQVLTPIFSGFLMDATSLRILFPYATAFVILAFVTMIFVKHGDSKPIMKKGLEALDVDD
ncbi:MAG: MFS transporter [Clostridia bacterium]|nr:MFS transporter [Clostridia bacterium]MBR3129887.1 MFS transporter [Clostridia bacterium]